MIMMPNPSLELPASSKAPNQYLMDMDVLCTFKTMIESQNFDMGVSKTSDHIQIKVMMPTSCQEPPASSKAPNDDLKDIDVLCIFKIKRDKVWNICVSKTCDNIQIKIKMPHPSQEHPAPTKAPSQGRKDIDVLCIFKIKIET